MSGKTMKAAVIYEAGGPEVLKVESRPIPVPQRGQVLIRVKAFGLNRSELFTRQGLSAAVVQFPRILGIECVGVVEEAPGNEFQKGETVATCMGGIGRVFDGAYAEFTCPPAAQVLSVKTSLDWSILGGLPEMLQTAWGSLFKSLRLQKGQTLLVRGGTTSVGLAAAAIAKNIGCTVAATTRAAVKTNHLLANGADQVFVDDGEISAEVREIFPKGVDKVLELVGTTTLLDSLKCVSEGGSVCMTGMVGNKWSFDDFSPMESIPTAVNLTTYGGGNEDFLAMPFNDLLRQVEEGRLKASVGKVYHLDEIVEAHRLLDSNKAGGKIVVLT